MAIGSMMGGAIQRAIQNPALNRNAGRAVTPPNSMNPTASPQKNPADAALEAKRAAANASPYPPAPAQKPTDVQAATDKYNMAQAPKGPAVDPKFGVSASQAPGTDAKYAANAQAQAPVSPEQQKMAAMAGAATQAPTSAMAPAQQMSPQAMNAALNAGQPVVRGKITYRKEGNTIKQFDTETGMEINPVAGGQTASKYPQPTPMPYNGLYQQPKAGF